MRERPRILVVDDEAHILHVVSLKLRNAGYDVVTAADGEEALALALDDPPDLVITDFQMPFMNGLDFCIAMKEDERTADIPALILTARGFTMKSEYGDRTNVRGVLTKPFSPREVLGRVEALLSGGGRAGVAA